FKVFFTYYLIFRLRQQEQQTQPQQNHSETQIIIDEVQTNPSTSLSLKSSPYINEDNLDSALISPNLYSSNSSREDVESRLSFIVKEKLHEFAKDLRRRTSQVAIKPIFDN